MCSHSKTMEVGLQKTVPSCCCRQDSAIPPVLYGESGKGNYKDDISYKNSNIR